MQVCGVELSIQSPNNASIHHTIDSQKIRVSEVESMQFPSQSIGFSSGSPIKQLHLIAVYAALARQEIEVYDCHDIPWSLLRLFLSLRAYALYQRYTKGKVFCVPSPLFLSRVPQPLLSGTFFCTQTILV
jgi:hypothetical protein